MSRLIDDFILKFEESKRYDYLLLNEFILDCSSEIYCEIKYVSFLFYCAFNRPILYIALDKKRQQFYMSFTDGKKLMDKSAILEDDNSKMVSKWFFINENALITDSNALRDLINQAIEYNRIKQIKN